ncbi:hypothetical protein SFUMM280S_09705 [Streptomyces fumanus]
MPAYTGLTEEEVGAGMEALESFSTLSLDAELSAGDDGYSLADTLGASDNSFDTVVDRESAKEGLRKLPERERAILYMRFFEDMTQSRIADRLGISQMHVSADQPQLRPGARPGAGSADEPARRPRPARVGVKEEPRNMLRPHPAVLRRLVDDDESALAGAPADGTPSPRARDLAYTLCVSTGTRDVRTGPGGGAPLARRRARPRPPHPRLAVGD